MQQDSAKIATLVGSRLCHDLVSPIGAISNGLELITLAGAPGPEEMSLIEESCASATARINFFRVAFGSASAEQTIGPREANRILARYCHRSRLSPHWQPQEDLPRGDVQLAFLAFLCCESALPQGGRISISRNGEGWRVSGTGPRIRLEDSVWEQLSSESIVADLAPARVQFAVLALLAADRNHPLSVRTGEAAATIEIH